jgi:quercetin dioxygenase-like cupin family protein
MHQYKQQEEDQMAFPLSIQRIILFALGFGLFLSVGASIGQQTPPEKAKGFVGKPLSTIDLAGEIEGMQGRNLRMSQVTLDPGGATPLHDHAGRPEIIYVLRGRLTENRGGEAKDYGPGETISTGKDTRHWIENKTADPVILIAVSIIKQP